MTDQVLAAEDVYTYRRMIRAEVTSRFPLDPADLEEAIFGAVVGTGLRVEHAETSEMIWAEFSSITVEAE